MDRLKEKIGFIGVGSMGLAILSGLLRANLIDAPQAIASDASVERLEQVEQITQVRIARDNGEVVRFADVVILAVKPYQVGDVAAEVRPHVGKGQLFVTICAGIPCSQLEEALGADARVVRVMPNTPSVIGCGSAGVAAGSRSTAEDLEFVCRIFDSVGTSVIVPEKQLNLITGLTGSGPAYVYHFIECLVDAGVRLGLTEKDSMALVGQMVIGASRMAVESEQPVPQLRRAVTTPGGTTEAGMKVLEQASFCDVIHRCVEAATRRSEELAKG